MDKYTLQKKPKEHATLDETEIRITGTGRIQTYISYAGKLFTRESKQFCTLKATGTALGKAVIAAEIMKRRFKGLHQITKVGSTEVVDTYLPKEEGLDVVEHPRSISFIEITLSKDPLDTRAVGYQAPLPEDQVEEKAEDELIREGGRKGRGKRGKNKSSAGNKTSAGSEGDWSGKHSDWKDSQVSKGSYKGGKGSKKGKGKGKGKKGAKGKGFKGKGKGKDGKGKGKKGKGKGKKGSKGKGKKGSKGGKGKGKSYGKRSNDWTQRGGNDWS